MCSDELTTTPNHPFYVRKKIKKWDNSNRKYIRKFKTPTWVKAKDLDKSYYVGTPINTNSNIPKWNGIINDWSDGRKSRKCNELSKLLTKGDFWYLIGRYMGDGWKRYDGSGIIICCNKKEIIELEQITSRLDRLNVHYCISEESTVYRVIIAKKEWYSFFKQFGDYAYSKHLTKDILDAPVDLLEEFLNGYLESGGYFEPKQQIFKISSVSSTLIYDIAQVVAKVYKTPFSVYRCERKSISNIEGRTVHQRPSYSINFKLDKRPQDKAFYESGYIWSPINNIKLEHLDHPINVYNMEVENDNSYTVQNIIVHNCTDLSIAGRQQGMDMNSGTRSSLLWECERLIKAKKPKYLMLENVKMLVSKKFKPQFDIWLQKLSDIGYNTYWKVLNAKDFGVPQNRERVFAISIRKDVDDKTFEFPKPFKLEKRLKDVLEPKVDKKFYLKAEIVNRFKFIGKPNIVGTTKTRENRISQKSRVYNPNGVIGTLTATDYKDPKRVTTSPVGNLNHYSQRSMNDVFGGDSISPTLNTMQGGNRQPKVLIKANNKKGYNEAYDGDSISLGHPNSDKKHSRVTKDVSRTLTTSQDVGVIRLKYDKDNYVDFSIRKLTPKECWRLMGFTDDQFEKAESVCSNTQLYKQAGNSIVVDVMEYIFKNLFK